MQYLVSKQVIWVTAHKGRPVFADNSHLNKGAVNAATTIKIGDDMA